jgi:hypothetical protein
MARYAGGGKSTVESCRSIDVLDWHRRGCLRLPRRFSWAWRLDGKRVASINAETERHCVTLKYRSRSYGEGWTDVEQRFPVVWTPCRFGGERPWFICSVYANGTYCGRQGFEGFSSTPSELGDFIKVQLGKWGKMIKDANIQLD